MTIVWPVMNVAPGPAQEGDGADDVRGHLVALERARADRDVLQRLDDLGVLVDAVAHREAGRDAVDEDVVAAELLGQRARQRHDRALARDVVQQERHAAERRARRDVHDPPAALRAHLRHDRAAGQEHAQDVDVHDLTPFVDRDLLEGTHRQRRVQPGVVDEDVDRAAALDGLRRHPRHVVLGGDVDGEPDAVGEVGRGRLGALEVGDHDPRAVGRQGVGDRPADALRAAGDDRDPALERAHRIGENEVGSRMRVRWVWISGWSFGRKSFQRWSACSRARRRSRSA